MSSSQTANVLAASPWPPRVLLLSGMVDARAARRIHKFSESAHLYMNSSETCPFRQATPDSEQQKASTVHQLWRSRLRSERCDSSIDLAAALWNSISSYAMKLGTLCRRISSSASSTIC